MANTKRKTRTQSGQVKIPGGLSSRKWNGVVKSSNGLEVERVAMFIDSLPAPILKKLTGKELALLAGMLRNAQVQKAGIQVDNSGNNSGKGLKHALQSASEALRRPLNLSRVVTPTPLLKTAFLSLLAFTGMMVNDGNAKGRKGEGRG